MCRSPCGERGLKLLHRRRSRDGAPSLPVRGAWIEISLDMMLAPLLLSLPVRGAWIEMQLITAKFRHLLSLPVRGAWIEISACPRGRYPRLCRSPCGERGLKYNHYLFLSGALCRSPCGERGLKYMGVMRVKPKPCPSLPVRGAWIEMMRRAALDQPHHVAPRAGSVD